MTEIDPGREVILEAGAERYTLYAGNRALRLIERETGEPFGDVVSRVQSLDITATTVVLWALTQREHPRLSIDDMDDIIDAAGIVPAMQTTMRALEKAFPEAVTADADALGKAAALNGAGMTSSPRRSRRA